MENLIQTELIKNAENIFKKNSHFSPSYQTAMKNAIHHFEQSGLPTKANDDWKFTRIGTHLSPRFYEVKNDHEKNTPDADVDSIISTILNARGSIIFINGVFNKFLSHLPEGLEFDTLPLTAHFEDTFDALNFGIASTPLSLKIKKNTSFDFPISIIHLTTDQAVNKITSPRLTITAENHTKVSFLELFTAPKTDRQKESLPYSTNAVTHFILQEDAHIEHVKIQTESKSAVHIGRTTAQLKRQAHFKSITIDYGALMARHNIQVDLTEEGAETSVHGLFALQHNEHTDIFSQIIHHAPRTTSDQLFKGMASGESHGIFTGKIIIKQDAQQSASAQLNKNLLLSKKAHIDTRPQLLVHADDVKCSHGATIGQLSEDEAFYLETRGMTKERAQAMLCHGFLLEVLFKIENAEIRAFAEKMLALNFATIFEK